MMTTIAKHFTFDAAHRLDFLPATHKCHRMHGHTYGVEIHLRGEPDENGFIVDYAEIAHVWKRIHNIVDHRVLNEIDGLSKPTTEVLVEWMWTLLRKPFGDLLYKVRVSESSSTWAEVGG